jgi:peptide/nickel transport system permease protein
VDIGLVLSLFFIFLSVYITKIMNPMALYNPLGLQPLSLGGVSIDPSIFLNILIYGGLGYGIHRMFANRYATIGFLAIVFAVLYVPIPQQLWIVSPSAPNDIAYAQKLCWSNPITNWGLNVNPCPAGTNFILGSDDFGRDLFQMILLAIPLDLSIALEIVIAATSFGVFLGAVAAYSGGKIDEVLLRITDIFFAVPALILALVLAAVLGRTIGTLTVAVLIVWWPTYVRLIRGQILSEKSKNYVEALRSLGLSGKRILFLHVIPNSIYPVLVQSTLDIGGVILTFSALMFLGFSPSPVLPELGNLAAAGSTYVFQAPWLITFPGITIVIISLAFNLIGDGIRDVLDPRLRR